MLLHLTKKREKEFFDYLLYFFVFTTPLFELPQAYDIYSQQSAHNVSVLTWTYFLLADFAWLAYAFNKKLKPLQITYSLYILVEALIVVGIFIYR